MFPRRIAESPDDKQHANHRMTPPQFYPASCSSRFATSRFHSPRSQVAHNLRSTRPYRITTAADPVIASTAFSEAMGSVPHRRVV